MFESIQSIIPSRSVLKTGVFPSFSPSERRFSRRECAATHRRRGKASKESPWIQKGHKIVSSVPRSPASHLWVLVPESGQNLGLLKVPCGPTSLFTRRQNTRNHAGSERGGGTTSTGSCRVYGNRVARPGPLRRDHNPEDRSWSPSWLWSRSRLGPRDTKKTEATTVDDEWTRR